MQRPGSIYKGANGREYLAVYSFSRDISVLLPPELRSSERVAAISYGGRSYKEGRKDGNVDVFLLPRENLSVQKWISVKKTFSRHEAEGFRVVHHESERVGRTEFFGSPTSETLSQYNVHARLVSSFPEEIRNEVLELTLADIRNFCDLPAKKRTGSSIGYVPRIFPMTQMRRITPVNVLSGGKAEFVPQCFLEANIDYTKGCLTSWIPGQDASFDTETEVFTDYWHFAWGDCVYCYALDKHKAFPKTVYEFDKQRTLEELQGAARLTFGSARPIGRPVDVLRFGKRTEPWTPWTEPDLRGTLEAMIETGTTGVITTKFMPFKPEIAELLRKTKSTVLYSTGGREEFELGPLTWGATNEFRIEQAAKYREAGVNAALFYLIHPIFPPTREDKKRLRFAEKHRIPVQFIPARFYRRQDAQDMIAPIVGLKDRPDISVWDALADKDSQQINFAGNYWWANSYEINYNGRMLVPKLDRMHSFWKRRLMNKDPWWKIWKRQKKSRENRGKIRMCAHDSKKTFCGGCFARPGTISETQHPENSSSWVKKSRRGNSRKKGDKLQIQLPILDQNPLPPE